MARPVSLALSALLSLSMALAAGTDGKQAEGALKGKGLRRSGSLYVLPAEAELSKKVRTAQAIRKELAVASLQSKMTARGAAESRRLVAALAEQRIQLRQQRTLATTTEQYNEITNALNDLADRINLLQSGREDPEMTKEREAAFAKRREAYLQSVLDARNLVREAEATYGTLAGDADLKAALDELNRNRKDKLRLGPSRSFRADAKTLEALEGTIASETIPLRNDNGSLWVDIVFNGKVSKAMVFDTGASLVNLPSDMAAEIGLKITDDLPTVEAHVADGGVVKAKLAKIPSMRLGKFAAEDVECIVMNGSRGDVPPLLGMSFLKHFIYKLDPANSTLTLTRVGGNPTETKGGSGARSQDRRRSPSP